MDQYTRSTLKYYEEKLLAAVRGINIDTKLNAVFESSKTVLRVFVTNDKGDLIYPEDNMSAGTVFKDYHNKKYRNANYRQFKNMIKDLIEINNANR